MTALLATVRAFSPAVLALGLGASPCALAQDAPLAWEIPDPTGPLPVGRTHHVAFDAERDERVGHLLVDFSDEATPIPPGGDRLVTLQLWYPAQPVGGTGEATGEGAAAARSAYNPVFAEFAKLPENRGLTSPYRTTTIAARTDAPVSSESAVYPVVLFLPGARMFPCDYARLCMELASHGYVVGTVGFAGLNPVSPEAGLVYGFWSEWKPSEELGRALDDESLREWAGFFEDRDEYLAEDVAFALDELDRMTRRRSSPFYHRLDLRRVALLAHSTGASVAARVPALDERVAALVAYDVILPCLSAGVSIDVPFLLIRGTENAREGWLEAQARTFDHVQGPAYDVVVRGAGPFAVSDRPYQRGDFDPRPFTGVTGVTGVKAVTRAIDAYTLAFLDATVRGRPSALLEGKGEAIEGATLTRHPER